jgi:hypothetical protein
MLTIGSSVRVYVAASTVDLRKGFDGLAAATRDIVKADPLSGHLFVFLNRRRDRLKILLWQRSGVLLQVSAIGTLARSASGEPAHRGGVNSRIAHEVREFRITPPSRILAFRVSPPTGRGTHRGHR